MKRLSLLPLRRAQRFVVLAAAAAAAALVAGASDRALAPAPASAAPHGALVRVPPAFVPNRGQFDSRIAFALSGRAASAAFGRSEVGLMLPRYTLRLAFPGARRVQPVGGERTSGVVSYFQGPRSRWKTGIPLYSTIVYKRLWPGIDLVYSGPNSRLESTYVIAPRAEPQRIGVRYEGAKSLRRAADGSLEIELPGRVLREGAPFAFQMRNGRRVSVPVEYRLRGRVASFRLGRYDRRLPLVIDPPSFVYAGYIGGGTAGCALAVDAAGSAYVTGEVGSTSAFPTTVGPDSTTNGLQDVFVAKVKADGSGLDYAGFIGGSEAEWCGGIAVDSAGNAYVTGQTRSGANFPVTVGPDLTAGGNTDSFVAKVKANGTSLEYAGFIGGWGTDSASGIAVDSTGHAYVVGTTDSSASDTFSPFPATVGPDTTYNAGQSDAFVVKVKSDGTGFDYAGYIGGTSLDLGGRVAVDAAGSAYVSGSTYSSESQGFPLGVGPDLTYNGLWDTFVAKVKADGTGLDYAGYVGGADDEYGWAIAVDADGSAYLAGPTESGASSFPVSVGPDLTENGGEDTYVAKVKPDGSGLDYAGFIGGVGNERAVAIAAKPSGSVVITGSTTSSEATFPVADGPDMTYGGEDDAFIVTVTPGGRCMGLAGYVGGAQRESPGGVAFDASGDAYIVGSTHSNTAQGFPATGGPDVTFNLGGGAFVAKIGGMDADAPQTTITSTPVRAAPKPATFTFSSCEPDATFECSLDGAAFTPCASPHTYASLPRRSHHFEVRAIGPDGKIDLSPATHDWSNGPAPQQTLTGAPPGVTNSTDASFSFVSTDPGARFFCGRDGGAFTACASPKTYTALSDGRHIFGVFGVDAGNKVGKPTFYSWTIDTSPPETLITKHPQNPTSATDAAFGFGTPDPGGVTFLCRLDADPFAACKKSMKFRSLSRASHTIEVKAVDAAGNVDPTPATFTWTIT